ERRRQALHLLSRPRRLAAGGRDGGHHCHGPARVLSRPGPLLDQRQGRRLRLRGPADRDRGNGGDAGLGADHGLSVTEPRNAAAIADFWMAVWWITGAYRPR